MEAEHAYLFSHAIMRDAAYELQLVSDRARLHAIAIELIENVFGGREHVPPSLAADMAGHAQNAMRLEDESPSPDLSHTELHYLEVAGVYAQSSFDLKAAADLYLLCSRHPMQTVDGAVKWATDSASVLSTRGEHEIATERAQYAVGLSENGASDGSKALALAMLGRMYHARAMRQEALQYYEQARPLAHASGDKEVEMKVLGGLGLLRRDLRDRETGKALLTRSLELATELGKVNARIPILMNLAVTETDYGRFDEARELLAEALRLAEEVGNLPRIAGITGTLAASYRVEDRFEDAIAVFPRAIELLEKTGNASYLAWHTCEYAICLAQTGRLDEATTAMQEGFTMLDEQGDTKSMEYFRTLSAHCFDEAINARLMGPYL
jgi:tetratricopeptide (TPR) repeat protein